MKSQAVERLHNAVSYLMTSMNSPQHRLIMATHFLETITDVPPTIADKLPVVLRNLRRLRNPEETWGESELKEIGESILDMYVEALHGLTRNVKDAA
jgi:hypothetical protein